MNAPLSKLVDTIVLADISGWLTPTGQYICRQRDEHHAGTILRHDNSLHKGDDYVALGYSRIEGCDTRFGYVNVECRTDKVWLVKRWLNKTLKNCPNVRIEMFGINGYVVEDYET